MDNGFPTTEVAQRDGSVLVAAHLTLALAQPLAAYTAELTGRGVSEVERAGEVEGPTSPAPGTFAIWLPLFATSVLHGARFLSHAPRDPAAVQATRWLTGTYGLNTSWSLHAQLRGLGWPSVGIIAAAAATASAALLVAERAECRTPDSIASANAAAPLAGWLTLATFANIESTLNQTQGRPSESAQTRRALVLLSGACATAGGVALASGGHPRYAAALAWGLGGVALRSVRERRTPVAVVAGLATAAAVAVALFGRVARRARTVTGASAPRAQRRPKPRPEGATAVRR